MKFLDDSYYIEQVLNGDKAAFASLVDKHKDMVFTIAKRISGNIEDAEEIAQDAFVKAFQALESFKQQSKFSTWLFRITYNTAISGIRKKRMETAPLDEQLIENYSLDTIQDTVGNLDEEDQKMIIAKALEKLPEQETLLITLFYMKEMAVEEISTITHLSESNVKVKLHRIRKKLYNEIQALYQKHYNEV